MESAHQASELRHVFRNRSVVLLYKSGLDPAREAYGGGKETRTPDPHAASVMLYQLSYAPKFDVVEMRRFELLTPCLQSRCSTN